jgi:hypothetical protein
MGEVLAGFIHYSESNPDLSTWNERPGHTQLPHQIILFAAVLSHPAENVVQASNGILVLLSARYDLQANECR